MKWFFSFNEDFKAITNVFLSSIKDKCDLFPLKVDNFKKKWKIGGGTEGAIARKRVIDYAFENTEEGEVFLLCDTDIKFYNPTEPIILNETSDSSIDLVVQKEHKKSGCNMGFMAIRNNENVLNFWNKLYKESIEKNIWEQKLLNDYLYEKENKIKWKTFPDKIWNWSMGKTGVAFSKETCLHHANCAVTVDKKLEQFNYVNNCIENNLEINYSIKWMQKIK
jgi:hypothetical protein